mgnify:CR=1 FL=1
MSSRLGTLLHPFQQGREPVEEIVGIVWTGRGLRVVLHRKGWQVKAFQTFASMQTVKFSTKLHIAE